MQVKKARGASAADHGAALAMVLIMVVVLSLWLASVGVLTQSRAAAVRTNAQLTSDRSAILSAAQELAMEKLTPVSLPGCAPGAGGDPDSTTCPRRIGTKLNPCDPGQTWDISFTPADITTIKNRLIADGQVSAANRLDYEDLQVNCSESLNSGQSAPLASFVVVGSANALYAPTGHYGINVQVSNSICKITNSPAQDFNGISAGGGVINSSNYWGVSPSDPSWVPALGVYSGIACDKLMLKLNAGASPNTEIGLYLPGSCPQSTGPSSLSGGSAQGLYLNYEQTATYPGNGKCPPSRPFSPSNDFALASSVSTPLVSRGLVQSYLDGIASKLAKSSDVSNVITSDGTCSAAGGLTQLANLTDPSSNSYSVYSVGPGRLSNALAVKKLSDAINACGSGSIVRLNGAIRLPAGSTLEIYNTIYLIGGTPVWSAAENGWSCNAGSVGSGAPGVEIQLEGDAQVYFHKGTICLSPGGNASQTVIASPLAQSAGQSLPTPFGSDFAGAYTTSAARDTTGTGVSASTGVGNQGGAIWYDSNAVSVTYKGLVYVPANWINEQINSSTIKYDQGVVTWGLYHDGTGSVRTSSEVNPPPLTNGDRLVQLNFTLTPRGVTPARPLARMQLQIYDFFGQKLAEGYGTRVWRSEW